jgi:hypothetical protein
MYRTAVRTATLSMLILASTAKAGQLPADMWAGDNKSGGRPSITAGPNGVSVVLPESSIVSDALPPSGCQRLRMGGRAAKFQGINSSMRF